MRVKTSSQISESPPQIENPRIVIKKEKRLLELFDGEKQLKTYKIALGFAPEGDKQQEGDGKTPEGEFYIFTKNDKSKYYLSLGVSYPNIEDAGRGLEDKIISPKEYDAIVKAINEKRMPPQNTRLGGEIYIHGGGIGKDWTRGCAALDDKDIKEIFETVSVGGSVKIEP
ncbi:MAG TPA: L,D-transpeptidase [Pyrinomonadaceae bacterium]|nr:L,D-transpeptidase [Pyrinomonadaceae bacterium]